MLVLNLAKSAKSPRVTDLSVKYYMMLDKSCNLSEYIMFLFGKQEIIQMPEGLKGFSLYVEGVN